MNALGLLIAFAVSPSPPPAPRWTSTTQLRNVAAADAVAALEQFALQKRYSTVVSAEPVSNTVVVSGVAAEHQEIVKILKALDVAPPGVVVRMAVHQVPAGFADDVGLGAGQKWVLTPREAKLLDAAVRREKDATTCARPTLTVTDNQAAAMHVEGTAVGIVNRVTPRVMPDGSVMLRAETQISEPSPLGRTTYTTLTILSTEAVPSGGTLVVRGPQAKGRDVLVVMTVDRVVTP